MKELFSFLDENFSKSEIVDMYNEFANNEGLEPLYNIEEIDEICANSSVIEIAGMVIHGNFNLNSEYFTFDGYGNFESVNSYEALEYIEEEVNNEEFYTELIESGYIDMEKYDEWEQENE